MSIEGIHTVDPVTGRKSWVRVFPAPADASPQTAYHPSETPAPSVVTPKRGILARIDAALAEAERQSPQWQAETEDDEGFITWYGGPDAADSARRDLRTSRRRRSEHRVDYGTPDGRPIGYRQVEVLRYVMHHPGCSAVDACGSAHSYGCGYADRAWALKVRGMLDIDATRPNRYRLIITQAGVQALRAHAARYGWVTGDPL